MTSGDIDGGAGVTLGDFLAGTVAAAPDRVAIVEDGGAMTWRRFADRVEGMAAWLAAQGVARGDRVALWLPNGGSYLAAIFAVARLGALAVHVNTRFGPAEVGDLLGRTRPTLLVTHSSLADKLARLRGETTWQGNVVAIDQADAELSQGRPTAMGGADDDCLIYTTGGTTSRPKLVVHRQSSIAAHARVVAAAIGTDAPGAAYLAAVPFCGTFGNIGAMAAVAGGATIVMMAAFDPDAAAALIRAHRVTHLLGDDRMVDRLAANGPFDGVRFCGAAAFGADARPALARGVAAGLAPRAIYGSSEVQALFALGDAAAGGWGAVTPVHETTQVAVIDDELRIAGPSLFDRYLDDPAATDAAFADGLFRTGDRARIEAKGFVFEGRMGDVLRLGGFLVSPLEIEAFLARQPGVAEVQVVGVEGERGTAAFAFAVARAGASIDEAALIAACRASLARYKVPVRVVALAEFPVSNGPNGPKIARTELRRLAAGHMTARERSAA